MPVRVGEMNLAVPVTAALAILLSAAVAGFVHARNCLTKLFFGFYGRCSHGILHGTKSGALEKGNSGGAFDHAHFVHAAAGNIHPPVRSGRHIPDRATARRNVRARKLFSFTHAILPARIHGGLGPTYIHSKAHGMRIAFREVLASLPSVFQLQ